MSWQLIKSWFKTNVVKILLLLLLFVVLVLIALTFWLKVRGFKITDLLLRLQVANAKNEVNHLQTKKAVLESKETIKIEDIKEIEKELKEEKKKIEAGKMKIEGMNDDEILARFNELGF
jgi:cell division protein YceG involved in septum cleavage